MRVIRAFVREDFETSRFQEVNYDLTATSLRVNRLFVIAFPAVLAVMNLTTVAILWLDHVVDSGQLSIGNLTAFMQYALQILFARHPEPGQGILDDEERRLGQRSLSEPQGRRSGGLGAGVERDFAGRGPDRARVAPCNRRPEHRKRFARNPRPISMYCVPWPGNIKATAGSLDPQFRHQIAPGVAPIQRRGRVVRIASDEDRAVGKGAPAHL